MKNYFASLTLLLSVAVSLTSCRDSSKLPAPTTEDVPLIIPEINPQKSFFSYAESRIAASTNPSRPVFEFVVNPSQGYGELDTVKVFKSYRRIVNSAPVLGPRVKVTGLTSFPATVSINSQDAITGLSLGGISIKALTDMQPNRIAVNDAVIFTFEYKMKDGRTIVITPLTADGVATGSSINAPLAAVAVFK